MRLYALGKRQPAILSGINLLDEPQALWLEFEVYAAEEARVANEANQRSNRPARSSGSSRLPSRRQRRN